MSESDIVHELGHFGLHDLSDEDLATWESAYNQFLDNVRGTDGSPSIPRSLIFGTPGTIEAYATTSLGEFFAEAQAVYSLNPQQDTPSSDPDCDHLLSTWESETRRLLRLHDQAPAAWDLITQQRTRDVRPVHTDEEIDAWRDYHQQIHR